MPSAQEGLSCVEFDEAELQVQKLRQSFFDFMVYENHFFIITQLSHMPRPLLDPHTEIQTGLLRNN